MIEQDTIKLLRECDAGVKMGTSSIEDVLDNVKGEKLEKLLTDCKGFIYCNQLFNFTVNNSQIQSLLCCFHNIRHFFCTFAK